MSKAGAGGYCRVQEEQMGGEGNARLTVSSVNFEKKFNFAPLRLYARAGALNQPWHLIIDQRTQSYN